MASQQVVHMVQMVHMMLELEAPMNHVSNLLLFMSAVVISTLVLRYLGLETLAKRYFGLETG